jgi:hypothetical protein
VKVYAVVKLELFSLDITGGFDHWHNQPAPIWILEYETKPIMYDL